MQKHISRDRRATERLRDIGRFKNGGSILLVEFRLMIERQNLLCARG